MENKEYRFIFERIEKGIKTDHVFWVDGTVIYSKLLNLILRKDLGSFLNKDTYMKYNDRNYFVLTKDSLAKLISDWKKRKYIKERWDCDNFAYAFKVYCMLASEYEANAEICVGRVSIVYKEEGETRRHALNLVLYIEDDNYHLSFFEPQTSELFCTSKLKGKYGDDVRIYFLDF